METTCLVSEVVFEDGQMKTRKVVTNVSNLKKQINRQLAHIEQKYKTYTHGRMRTAMLVLLFDDGHVHVHLPTEVDVALNLAEVGLEQAKDQAKEEAGAMVPKGVFDLPTNGAEDSLPLGKDTPGTTHTASK